MKRKNIILAMLISVFLVLVVLPATVSAVGEPIAVAVEVNNFSSSNTGSAAENTLIRTDGNAAATGGLLRLVQDTNSQAGTAVRRNQIKLTDGFSTYFQFRISSASQPADGLALIVYENDTVQIGAYGGGLGYSGIANSLAVEFDAYLNSEYGDPSAYHAAIMLNGTPTHSDQPAGSMASNSNINNGSLMHVWVDYDGSAVTATFGTSANRSDSGNTTISRNVGSALVGKNVFLGFSASTGGSCANHDISKWYFKDGYVSGGLSSSDNAYVQGAATVSVALNGGSSNPASATINVYDASGAVITNQAVDIYMDNTLVTSGNTGAAGYTHTISGLSSGSHTLRAVAAGGASNYALFSIVANPPNITSGPAAQSKDVGQTASFSVSASSPDGGTLTYQWQSNSGSGFTNISDTNSASYTTGTLSILDNGKSYRCVVTNTKDGNAASATSGAATLTVNRLTGMISITGDPSKTYDGTPVADPAVSKTVDGAVTYAYFADNSGSVGTQLSGAPVNAGVYWVRATAAQTDTYAQVSADRQFIIGKKTIDDENQAKLLLSYSFLPKIYNATPQPVSVTAGTGVTGLGVITVYYEGTGGTTYAKSTIAPAAAGNYTISADIAQGDNYGSFLSLALGDYFIEKAAITGVSVLDYAGTYDGSEHRISISGLPDGALAAYRTTGSGEYDLSVNPSFTHMGSYTVYYKISKANYYDLEGSREVVINPRTLTAGMVADIVGTFTYNGVQQVPEPVIADGDPSIISAADYMISYSDNVYPGTATVTVSAAVGGNYCGDVSKTFIIGKKALDEGMIANIEEVVFNGAQQTPVPVVKDGNPSILDSSDYTVSYADNIIPGSATVTIKATPHGNYTGSASRTFTIKKKELSPEMIAEITPATYNGKAYTPALTVADGVPSIIKADDFTVSYLSNIHAGTATATITATANGNYTGSASRSFTINKKILTQDMIAEIAAEIFNGAAHTPGLSVADGSPSSITTSDYTVGYSDNVRAGTAIAAITATESGNYAGWTARTFVINKKELTAAMIASIAPVTYNGEAQRPEVTVSDGSPSIITSSDYTVSYSNNTRAGAAAATVMAAANGNYTGSVGKPFLINPASLKGSVKIPSAIEKGKTVQADVSGIQPAEAQSNLIYQWKRDGIAISGAAGSSYAVGDADVGRALSVTVVGRGNYTGSVTSAPANVTAPKTAPQIVLTAPVFASGSITFGGTVKMPGSKFTATISYKSETASAWTVIENGNYSDEKTFDAKLSGLVENTVYIYRVTVTGEDGKSYVASGRFLTPKSGGTAAKGSISGTVRDNSAISTDISVTIERGNTVIASAAGLKSGDTFSFAKLPDGIYNVVAGNGAYRVTQIITVQNGAAVGGVQLTIDQKQSVLEIKTEDTPDIAVGGLNDLFNDESMYTRADAMVVQNGGTVEIKLVAEKQEAADIDGDDKEKIEGIAGVGNIAMYLDLSVLKTVFQNNAAAGEQIRLTELPSLIEVVIPIPENLKGMSSAAIYRVHEGIAEAIPNGAENANADGEYCVVGNDYITLYIKKFSTYAIGFADGAQAPGVFQTYWWLPVMLAAAIVVATLIMLRKEKKSAE